jgi:hypothetical protein
MTDDLALPEGTKIVTPEGVHAVIGKRGRIRPETVRKERGLGAPSLREVGELATRVGGRDEFGRDYGRIDLT